MTFDLTAQCLSRDGNEQLGAAGSAECGGFARRAREEWAPRTFALTNTRLVTPVKGAARLPEAGSAAAAEGFVFVSNHQSWMDVPTCFRAVPLDIRFVSKAEMGYIPLVGEAMRRSGMVLLDRANTAESRRRMEEGSARLRGASNVMCFPEGTRATDPESGLQPFKKGAFHLAVASGKAVVPMAIHGTAAWLPRWGFAGPWSWHENTTVRVAFGEAIPTKGLGAGDVKALAERARKEVARLRAELAKDALTDSCSRQEK